MVLYLLCLIELDNPQERAGLELSNQCSRMSMSVVSVEYLSDPIPCHFSKFKWETEAGLESKLS